MTFSRFIGKWAATGLALVAGACLAAESGVWGAFDGSKKLQMAQPREPQVRVSLIAANKNLVPLATNTLAVVVRQKDGWHTYWKMPGDAGLPTTFRFSASKNLKIQQPSIPIPERFLTSGIATLGYSDTAIYPFQVDVPRNVVIGARGRINVTVRYLACKDVCVPGKSHAQIRLPYAVSTTPSTNFRKVQAAQRLIPEIVTQHNITATIEENRVRIDIPENLASIKNTVTFYPTDEGVIDIEEEPIFQAQNRQIFLKTFDEFAQKPHDKLRGVLVADGGPEKQGWAIEIRMPLTAGSVPVITPTASLATVQETAPTSSARELTTWTALCFALLGGLILNLMPCVFPVLSLKLFGLVEESRKGMRLLPHGLAFTAGVITSMLILSGSLLALRASGAALGWGFQLQSPWMIAFLILLFTGIAINLLGWFEFTALSRFGGGIQTPAQKSIRNSFLTGVLTVLVASPCTAPFMGAALGYALIQPAGTALSIFTALGLGMSLPWLLLCVVPSWTRFIPKPGPWMETFRHWLALPMALTVLWLIWVLQQLVSTTGLIFMICGILALGIALWLLGRAQWGRTHNFNLMRLMAALSLACWIGTGISYEKPETTAQEHSMWQPWSRQAVQAALAEQKPVFVDFTAAWCITCQANKISALRTEHTTALFRRKNVVTLEADWTHRDEKITRVLTTFNRSGVPLYLLYLPNGRIKVLPELLTEDIIRRALP